MGPLLLLALALVLGRTGSATPLPLGADPLWLRYPLIADSAHLHSYRALLGDGTVSVESGGLTDASSLAQLHACAEELSDGLSGLLGLKISASCCSPGPSASSGPAALTVRVVPSDAALGEEGFRLSRSSSSGVILEAKAASGALYGSFRLLSFLQRGEPVPSNFTSTPAMALRIWDLWDVLSGEVTRGYAGRSLIWPMALCKLTSNLSLRVAIHGSILTACW